jgi:beta-mannosidase
MAKNFYAPVAGNLVRTDNRVEAYIQNEKMNDVKCFVQMTLKSMDFEVLHRAEYELIVSALSAAKAGEMDYSQLVKGKEEQVYIEAVFIEEGGYRSIEVATFVPYKHLELEQPELSFTVKEEDEKYEITLQAERLACFVELDFADRDAIFSDNFFYITSKEPRVIDLYKSDIRGEAFRDASDLSEKLLVRSLRDSYE